MEEKHYSVQEVTEFLEHLDGLTLARLQAIARVYAASVPALTADDLLQEAFSRTLDGRRKWRKSVDAPRHFEMTISSVRDSHLKSVRRKDKHAKTVLESDLSSAGDDFNEDRPDVLETAMDMSADPAGLALAEDLVNEIEKEFSDETDMLMVEAIIEGLSGKETMELLGIGEKEYGAINRRIRRKLQKILGRI